MPINPVTAANEIPAFQAFIKEEKAEEDELPDLDLFGDDDDEY